MSSTIQQLSSQLLYGNEMARNAALTELIRAGDEGMTVIRQALAHPDKAVSLALARVLAERDDIPDQFDLMVEALASPYFLIAELAARTLGNYGERAVEPLVAMLPSCHVLVQVGIVATLEHIGSRDVVKPLMELLKTTGYTTLRYTIIQALGSLGDPVAVDLIRSFSDDLDYHVKERVKITLKQLLSDDITDHIGQQETVYIMNVLDNKRIFIVEDDVRNMAVYSVMLKNSGAKVIQDAWNADTTSLIKKHLPLDIILLDLMLRNDISGYDIFDAIKTDPELANIPVVAVSASDPEIEIPRAQKKGFAGFIGKPISLKDFPAQIAACIDGKQLWLF